MSALAAVRAINKAHRLFDRLQPAVRHTLRVTSTPDLHGGRLKHGQARIVPSVWGSRRDDYRWGKSAGGRHDVVEFRAAAAMAAGIAVHHPLPAWAGVLPGTMTDVMDTCSDLYLADYWVLVLHHLVWTGRLPYPVHAEWVDGRADKPAPYHFVSELPTDLAEASREALILLEESALTTLNGAVDQRAVSDDASPLPRGLPSYRLGRWDLSVPVRLPATPNAPATPTVERDTGHSAVADTAAVAPTMRANEAIQVASVAAEGDRAAAALTLDDQTFTARYGAAACRFPPRGKLLFALLERVARRPGHRVDFDDLRANGDVWDGSLVEDSTIRGAVARLRTALDEHETGTLAMRIQTGSYRGRGYVLLDVPGAPDSNL